MRQVDPAWTLLCAIHFANWSTGGMTNYQQIHANTNCARATSELANSVKARCWLHSSNMTEHPQLQTPAGDKLLGDGL